MHVRIIKQGATLQVKACVQPCLALTPGLVCQVVLTGEGKNFCAGIDTASLSVFADFGKEECPARGRERLLHRVKQYQDTITSIEQCRWPVIAAVHGRSVVLREACATLCCSRMVL